jgi:hypothetical protein
MSSCSQDKVTVLWSHIMKLQFKNKLLIFMRAAVMYNSDLWVAIELPYLYALFLLACSLTHSDTPTRCLSGSVPPFSLSNKHKQICSEPPESVLMELAPCLAAMEDYRHLFEENHQMRCGPIALFIKKRLRQSI